MEQGEGDGGLGGEGLLDADFVMHAALGMQVGVASVDIIELIDRGEAHLAGMGSFQAGPFEQVVVHADQVGVGILGPFGPVLDVLAETEDHAQTVDRRDGVLKCGGVGLQVFIPVQVGTDVILGHFEAGGFPGFVLSGQAEGGRPPVLQVVGQLNAPAGGFGGGVATVAPLLILGIVIVIVVAVLFDVQGVEVGPAPQAQRPIGAMAEGELPGKPFLVVKPIVFRLFGEDVVFVVVGDRRLAIFSGIVIESEPYQGAVGYRITKIAKDIEVFPVAVFSLVAILISRGGKVVGEAEAVTFG